jgi:prepilin-type N-terminal cleavage/methylation domain-containing protein
MQHTLDRTGRPTRRAGMTLIELLIVMTIIAVLASLSIGAVFTLREAQMKSFTETTLTKLASALDLQWKAAMDTINDELKLPPPPTGTPLGNLRQWCTTTAGGDSERAKVIYAKARLAQEFPVTFDMAQAPVKNVLGINPGYQAEIGNTPSAGNQEWESAALLYLALRKARRGMVTDFGEIDPSSIQQQGNFKIFVDAWGRPLRYYIFPVNNDELANKPDPQDPANTLQNKPWRVSPQGALFITKIHTLDVPHRLVPVIASAGRDANWGIDQTTMAVQNPDQANDNIYSYRLRQVGARGD